MSNSDLNYWKVRGENRYFKKITDSLWSEYSDNRHLFDYDFIKQEGSNVFLKKRGKETLYLKLGSTELTFGETEDKLERHLNYGNWINTNNESRNLETAYYYEETKPKMCYRGGG